MVDTGPTIFILYKEKRLVRTDAASLFLWGFNHTASFKSKSKSRTLLATVVFGFFIRTS